MQNRLGCASPPQDSTAFLRNVRQNYRRPDGQSCHSPLSQGFQGPEIILTSHIILSCEVITMWLSIGFLIGFWAILLADRVGQNYLFI